MFDTVRSVRLVTMTAAVGAALLSLPMTQSMAQSATTTAKTPAQAATSSQPETVEQRISQLKTALKITPDQETKWNAVAQAMRENAAAMDKLVKEKRAQMGKMTAVDDLKTYQEFTEARSDGLKNLVSAFDSLYDSMPADQKKNADMVFMNFGPHPAKKPSQG